MLPPFLDFLDIIQILKKSTENDDKILKKSTMILNETYTLNSGYKTPKIAFGTWQIDNIAVVDAVKTALSL